MNRKFAVTSLSLFLCMSMISCSNTGDSLSDSADGQVSNVSEEEWLTEVSHTAIDNLSELVGDENYIKTYVNSQEITDIVKNWQGAEVKTDEIYVTHISEDDAKSFMELSGGMDYDSLSPVARNSLYKRIVNNTVPTYITGRQGVNYVAACSMLNDSVSYAVDYDIGNQLWFMPTDKDGLAVCIAFGKSGENVISVSGSYLYYGEEESLKGTLDTYVPYLKAELKN